MYLIKVNFFNSIGRWENRGGRVHNREKGVINKAHSNVNNFQSKTIIKEEKVGDKVIKKTLASIIHSSGVQYIAACNCGRRQANRYGYVIDWLSNIINYKFRTINYFSIYRMFYWLIKYSYWWFNDWLLHRKCNTINFKIKIP